MGAVFGPVPSRRLGQSLGIDPIPLKTCNWNCVYCQLGRTVPLTNERREDVPREAIVAEVRQALAAHGPGAIDWVTFVGSGEPTLHAGLGWLIRAVKGLTDLPVAVITNGALLYLPEVREELAAADAVLPTLDAGDAATYRRINRPWPTLTFERLIAGLLAFRRAYHGRLWLEVMLVRGLNDDAAELSAIRDLVRQIAPDEVHLNRPTRPPAEPWVEPTDDAGLLRATAILGPIARVLHPAAGSFDLSGSASVADAILEIVTRHPMREDELRRAVTRWAPAQVDQVLRELSESGRVQVMERYGARFWAASRGRYP
jgi:wyosine [tRNA(Phe)-imidazoG37] synthetase (radical SAM superfamily)